MELINYQPAETDQIIELESRRTRLTDVYMCVLFNGYVQEKIRKYFMKRVIINGMTGSSWRFKRFGCLSIILTSVNTNLILFFCLKIEYISFEAEDESAGDNEELAFSDNEGEHFIDDSNEEGNQSSSFYRFMNQTHDPAESVNDDDGLRLDRPEMFYCINREHVEFDEFDGHQKCAEKFKKSLCSFQDDDNPKILFFNAIL